MNPISSQRLDNQCVTRTRHTSAAGLVAWLGAVQAQEFAAAKWGLALRLPEPVTDAAIEHAFNSGEILRTHVMRPTWHFVAAADIRWMLELTGPRVQRIVSHYCRRLGVDAATLTRAAAVFERELAAGPLTRQELAGALARAGIPATGVALGMIIIVAELEAVICSGPRRGGALTYARLADRAPATRRRSRDEALSELTARFFRSHGPATIRDFVWWSGLTTADAKRGLEMNAARRVDANGYSYWTVGDQSRRRTTRRNVHLLPIYDEYLVAHRDRDAVPHGPGKVPSRSRGVVPFRHAVIVGGQVAGTWRTGKAGDRATVDIFPLRALTRSERTEIEIAGERYRRFLSAPVTVSICR